jgi:hypothetical protein
VVAIVAQVIGVVATGQGYDRLTMPREGRPVPLKVRETVNGYVENTLVWERDEVFGDRPPADTIYHVTVGDVALPGLPQPFGYDGLIVDPGG